MRRALAASPATRPVTDPVTIPAPVGGWNARDSIAAMPITDAERMINWFPEATYVTPRTGSETFFSGFSGQAETLVAYTGAAVLELFVAAGTNIWNATGGASASASTLELTGLTSARLEYVNFSTPGGNFAMAVNGADTPKIYDGSAWSAASINFISGSADKLANIHAYANRLFFTEKSTLNFVYMDSTNAIAGSAKRFSLGSLFAKGGELLSIGSWTRDGGDGMDDAIAFVTDQGEVAIYVGTDPSSATTWGLQGVYTIPKPLGKRCLQKFGGDLLVATEGGVYPMSVVLSGVEPQALITDKIHPAVASAVRVYRANYGWQLKYYPLGHWLIFNVPVKTGDLQEQYVMNTNTGAWCRFRGLDANCWELHNNALYFGANGSVIQADTGTNDDGANIDVDVLQAPTDFGYPGFKRFTTIRPFINSDSAIPIAIGMSFDFADRFPVSVPSPSNITIPYWGIATWSNPSYNWAGRPTPQGSIQSGGGAGVYGAMRLRGPVNMEILQWNATQVTFERGAYV